MGPKFGNYLGYVCGPGTSVWFNGNCLLKTVYCKHGIMSHVFAQIYMYNIVSVGIASTKFKVSRSTDIDTEKG